MHNIAQSHSAMAQQLYAKLNLTVLTTYLHGASGPDGNPGGVERCSPPSLLGPCNEKCAGKYFGMSVASVEDMRVSASCNMTLLKHQCFHTGNVLKKLDITDPDACCAACQGNTDCTHWTVNTADAPACHIKGGTVGRTVYDDTCTSGAETAPPAPPCASGNDFPICGVPGCD